MSGGYIATSEGQEDGNIQQVHLAESTTGAGGKRHATHSASDMLYEHEQELYADEKELCERANVRHDGDGVEVGAANRASHRS